MHTTQPPKIVLASSSPYRQAIFKKFALPFTAFAPAIDESRHDNERATDMVERLALEKAMAGMPLFDNALIIGSDQVCVIDEEVLGKPHEREVAIEQLKRASGKQVTFYTGIALINSDTGEHQSDVEPFHVDFRELTEQEIVRYIDKELPLDCAGSFKCEGLGIALFNAMHGRDPNTLVGLPLIRLREMLEKEGVSVI
ncbi:MULTISPECIES: Maf family protein [Salinivibrio]|uniref:7-methyl-GTP pyrophosphatase n=2 Tax=Salinivibrio TaxID=51366 RepID=A0AA47KJ13_9GAMM|nr:MULTISPECIES: nucleoside triphosphate pyrophosphatase [Salinivibrio]OOE88653.1 septum formation inhibitor Maf [Salinivibrio sharmensis]WBA07825.1 Maf family protein [Salinivibrio kushneri]